MRPIALAAASAFALAGALSLATIAPPAAAATMTAFVGPGSANGAGPCNPSTAAAVTGGSPVSTSMVCGGNDIGVATGQAFASFGHIGAKADAATVGGTSIPAQIGATAIFSDTLFFTSTDPTADTAEVTLNVILGGALNAAGPFASSVGSGVRGFVLLHGQTFQFLYDKSSGGVLTGFNDLLGSGTIGPDALLHSPTVLVGLHDGSNFALSLEVGASSVGQFASASSDFSGSFKLPTGIDVFDLPEGVTVNAGDWLVNNRFIDPLAPTAGVPEPAAWALMLTGFGLAGASLRRRRELVPT